jgi:cell wall-associated NlpC family hydrolase
MRDIHVKVLFAFFSFVVIYCAGLRPNPKFNNSSPKEGAHSSRKMVTLDGSYSEFQRRLADEIQSYLGVPYRWGGVSRSGMDCSGFVSTVYQNVTGLKLPRKARSMYKYGHSIGPEVLKVGDLVFFERIENDGISHVGIYVQKREFAHASTSEGVKISSLDDEYYRSRFVGARRIYNY